ncbi:hypothetical protein KSP39_PZI016512 [Platanthera zijinensis]|uniref:Uncharacterized protein n=1 Tax=Platanthera zijinensis TaxID=2320716 RepID=A0AAP0B8V6_9ASPA
MALLISNFIMAFVTISTAEAGGCYCECITFCKVTMPGYNNCGQDCEPHCLNLGKPKTPEENDESCPTKLSPKYVKFLRDLGLIVPPSFFEKPISKVNP